MPRTIVVAMSTENTSTSPVRMTHAPRDHTLRISRTPAASSTHGRITAARLTHTGAVMIL